MAVLFRVTSVRGQQGGERRDGKDPAGLLLGVCLLVSTLGHMARVYFGRVRMRDSGNARA